MPATRSARINVIIALLGTVAALGWWLARPQESAAIDMGLQVFSGLEPLVLAQEKGFYKSRGFDVRIRRFTSLADSKRAFRRYRIDATTMTVFDAILLTQQGVKFKIPLLVDYTSGANAIVAVPVIKKVTDLKGKRVGVTAGAALHSVVLAALHRQGMKESDIILVDRPPDELVRMMLADELDAASLVEPFLTQVKASGKSHVIFSSVEVPNLIADVLVLQEALEQEHPGVTRAIVEGYYQALDFWKSNEAEAVRIMAASSKLTPAEFRTALEGVVITGRKENQAAFGSPGRRGILHETAAVWERILTENHYLSRASDLESRLNGSQAGKAGP